MSRIVEEKDDRSSDVDYERDATSKVNSVEATSVDEESASRSGIDQQLTFLFVDYFSQTIDTSLLWRTLVGT